MLSEIFIMTNNYKKLSFNLSRTISSVRLMRGIRHYSLLFCSVFLLVALWLPVTAYSKSAEEVDFLSLAALMIKNDDYARAAEALDKVDKNNDKLDRKRFYTLSGIISLNRELYLKSIAEFESAIRAGEENTVLYVYLAQAYMGLEKYAETIVQLAKVGDLEKTMPGIWMLRSQAHWLNKDIGQAWNVLAEAKELFPQEKTFLRNKIFYSIELGLFQEAVSLGKSYIKNYDASVNDYVSLGDALRQSGEPKTGLKFLELARLNFPGEKNVYVAMAHAYLDLDKTFAAAKILEEGAAFHHELRKDSAQLFKQAGDYDRALFNNSIILDQKYKMQQRMALYIALNNYDQVLAMYNDLLRVRLLDEPEFQYAMAYAYFKTGDYYAAEKKLETITDARIFRKATSLRKIMADCANEKWLC